MMFFAHSTDEPDRSDWQTLAEHSWKVGWRAGKSAAVFEAEELARTAGLLHDIGKYTEDFQRRIAGAGRRVDHATRGAMLARERYGPIGQLLAYCIAGHHAGLANGIQDGERTPLDERLRGAGLPPLLDAWRQEVELPETLGDIPLQAVEKKRQSFQMAFLARMLFSCLIDADRLDTEAFYDRVARRESARDAAMPTLIELRERLNTHLAGFAADSCVNRIRAEILDHVRRQFSLAPGLFSLTVPTGGGKTLASLAFALDHAIAHGLRRVIFVIPFTSIIEQNAAVFRHALGDLGETAVLEHHSAYNVPPLSRNDAERYQSREKLRLAAENWDAPVIVTTAVQFFESLFAAHPSQCRKLHNIAGSVVILDEAQTLPLKLLRPTVAAIDELARNYHVSLVLCTATQPALNGEHLRGGLEKVRELAPDPLALFRKLARVKVRHVGELDDEGLLAYLRANEQVLCIVNNRRHARAVYRAMEGLPGARHLTTLMCARHRRAALDEIRADLKAGRPCRLVSTSLIEAGVDVDFPLVLRAEAGLDSIAQAAGRCNREGRRDAAVSEVLIFVPVNKDWAPPPELMQSAQAAAAVFRCLGKTGDLLSPEAILAYCKELYWTKGEAALDAASILGELADSRIDTLPMENVAKKFRMIDDMQLPVIVPYDDEARQSLRELRHAEKSGGLARRLQAYLVQVPQAGFQALRRSGAIQPVAPEKWGEQFMELVTVTLYNPDSGLWWEGDSFLAPESLVW
ncbi:MAG: CRISPR-associated endonuclease Cas3'' [Candidatus Accumulibacter sp.]|jgi:CRISPR-associated endonuclease/helicase Cas3|nr:CRISPR-associated endonuclease Cas3'' [Accumulibacter sp.]